jgi:hypothetical protein
MEGVPHFTFEHTWIVRTRTQIYDYYLKLIFFFVNSAMVRLFYIIDTFEVVRGRKDGLGDGRAPVASTFKAILVELVVHKGIVDLLLGVHDKGTMLNNRLLQRLASDGHKVCILVLGLDLDCIGTIFGECEGVVGLTLKLLVTDVGLALSI